MKCLQRKDCILATYSFSQSGGLGGVVGDGEPLVRGGFGGDQRRRVAVE